jgi:Fe-coproporphyrin III synthase
LNYPRDTRNSLTALVNEAFMPGGRPYGEHLSAQPLQPAAPLQRLPLVTLYLTERCNSRCVTCDYWRHGRTDLDLESVRRLLPSLAQLQTQVALISGGEPLLNPQWREIAALLRSNGLQLWLLTSGLSLAKHARPAAGLFQSITVSVDGTDRETYRAIRGLDAFDNVCTGIRAAVAAAVPVGIRVTLQRANYRQLPEFVELARQLNAQQVSFLPVDVANPHAFGRTDDFAKDLALQPTDLLELERILTAMERDHAEDFRSGFIAENPRKLRRIHQYFSAVCGRGPYPPVHCNVTEFSAVIGADGHVSPCFFIPGPAASLAGDDLAGALNAGTMVILRESIARGARPECARCVCSMWRDPDNRAPTDFLLRGTTRESSARPA